MAREINTGEKSRSHCCNANFHYLTSHPLIRNIAGFSHASITNFGRYTNTSITGSIVGDLCWTTLGRTRQVTITAQWPRKIDTVA